MSYNQNYTTIQILGKGGLRAKRHTWGRSQYAYHLQKISPFRLAVQRRDERCNTRIDPSGSRYQKNRLAITGKRSENHNDLANYLVAEEGSNLDDIYDLAVTTDGKIFFACRPDLPDDGKDVRNAIQAVVDAWLIFDNRDGGA